MPSGLPITETISALTHAVQPGPRRLGRGSETRIFVGRELEVNTESGFSFSISLTSGGASSGAGSGALIGALTPLGVLPGLLVGGAVGAGVGGAVGAVNGVLGIPYRGYRCRGYYNRYGRFHCYR